VLWDPGNAFFVGERAHPEGYAHVRGLLAHVHLKDAVRASGGAARWVELGTGGVDLAGQLTALASDRCAGVITMEDHHVPPSGGTAEGVRASFRALQTLVRATRAP